MEYHVGMKKRFSRVAGFTVLELIVVAVCVVILGSLAAMAFLK
jgi:type II secretory pathway pseudopilin PulG